MEDTLFNEELNQLPETKEEKVDFAEETELSKATVESETSNEPTEQDDLSNECKEESDESETVEQEPDVPVEEDYTNSSLVNEKLDETISIVNRTQVSISETSDTLKTISSEVREIHKLYQNEFAGRLRTMQTELDQYHKSDQRKVYDEILSDVARIYNNYEDLGEGIEDAKLKKNINYLMMDLTELLENYDVKILKSNPGDKRNPYHSKIVERILTENKDKHDTVAKSYNTGFYIENRTLIKEIIDVYVYSEQLTEVTDTTQNEAADNQASDNKNYNAGNTVE